MKMKEAVSKKRKVSKKTKRSWRKNVDTKDVDNFLEEKRLEERLGAPFSERSDKELFAVDKIPEVEKVLSTKQQRRIALKAKEPVCFAILKPHSAVPDPISKRNRVKTPEERKNPITRRIEAAKRLNGQLKLKEITSIKDKALAEKKRANKPKLGDFNKDIWSEDEKPRLDLTSEWLTTDTVRHTLANTAGAKKKRVPLSVYKKPSVVPAVEAPHPGISYNPSYVDHQDLLANVAEKEIKLMKEEAHLERVTTRMFKKVTGAKKGESWMEEMSEGLPTAKGNKEETSDAEDHDPNVKSVNPPVKNDKKPLVKRRKQKEQRKLMLELKQAKVEKKKVADIYKLKRLDKQIAAKEKKEEMLRNKRLKVKEKTIGEPKTLSRVKFEAPEPDFELAEELVGNLRSSKPIGNLLRDRYKSLQQRNIIAPGTRVLKRNKAKVKKFEKASHKMGWEDTFK